jgi:hypothetical protein
VVGKKFAYCWRLRIGGPHPISEAALGDGCQPNDYARYVIPSLSLKHRHGAFLKCTSVFATILVSRELIAGDCITVRLKAPPIGSVANMALF